MNGNKFLNPNENMNGAPNGVILPVSDTKEDMTVEIDNRKIIGLEEIRMARKTFENYRSRRQSVDRRIIENQEWWRLRNWGASEKKKNELKPSSGQLFSALLAKHADAMDSYPEAVLLPRSADDENVCKKLNSILSCVFDECRFRARYSSGWWDKLIPGVAIYGIYWNPHKNGIGDIDIINVDPLCFYSDPRLPDIQKSRNVFTVERVLKEELIERYPQLEGKELSSSITLNEYRDDDNQSDDPESCIVIEWYYKRNGILHYCKFCGDEILFSSENELDENGIPKYPDGWYRHGKYPFVTDVMFPVKDSPFGSGIVDCSKNAQRYIDMLEDSILNSAVKNSKSRYFCRANGDVNKEEFADTDNELVSCGTSVGEDSIRAITPPAFNGNYLSVLEFKVNELKETTHNRDFSNGSSASGVTSGSAIAALQESGNKVSRDMIGESYFNFVEICYIVIELMREFYTEQRTFRITGIGNEPQFAEFSAEEIGGISQNEFGVDVGDREPIFDIKAIAQKRSPYSREIQNQRAQELYGMGFFSPDNATSALACLEMMDFEGKDKLVSVIQRNNQQFMLMQQMAQELAQIKGALGMLNAPEGVAPESEGASREPTRTATAETDESNNGNGINTSAADKMRLRVQNGANPNL